MIICRSCGNENEDNVDFCASCGTFLEWTGERIQEEKPPPRAQPRPTPTPTPPPPVARSTPPPKVAPTPSTPPKPAATPAPGVAQGRSSVRITSGTPPKSMSTPAAVPAPAPGAEKKPDVAAGDGAPDVPAPAAEVPAAAAPTEEAPVAAAPAATDGAEAADASAPAPAEPAQEDEEAAAAKAKAEADARVRALVTRPTATQPVARTPAKPPPKRPAAATSGGTGTGAQAPRQPTAQQPTAQKPAAAKPRVAPKPPKPKQKQEYKPGDVICGECGQGNAPTRKFCQKCGASLVHATVVTVPWWKKIFRREKKVYKAGERKTRADGTVKAGRSGKWRKIKNVVVLLAAVFVVLSLFGPWKGSIRTAKDKVRGFFVQTYEPLHADGIQATSSLPDHPPDLAIDGAINFSWQENVQGDGEGQKLVLTFNRQVDIDRIGLRSGVSNKQEEFLAQPRPREVHVTFSDGSASDITLKDVPDFQNFKVKARNVVSMEITVISVYTSFRGGHDMGIAEVELFTKK